MDKKDFVRFGSEPCPTPDNCAPSTKIRTISEDQQSQYFSLMTRLRMTSNVEEQALIILALNAIIFGNS